MELMASARATAASGRGRWALGAGTGAVTLALAALAARHFASMSWPLSTAHPGLLVAAALLLVLAQALKAFGWGRLFTPSERPTPMALAAGNGGAALVGVLLPGRFDDAMRVAVVRRYPGCPAGVRVLCLSLVMLGLIDSVALAPLALAGAALPNIGVGVRTGLAFVAAGGVAAALVIAFLPRIAASRRMLRYRIGRWVNPRTTSLRHASEAWALVSACWIVRAVAFFLLLAAFGVGWSLPLALLLLCTGAAAAALPVGSRRGGHAGRRRRGRADRDRRRCLSRARRRRLDRRARSRHRHRRLRRGDPLAGSGVAAAAGAHPPTR